MLVVARKKTSAQSSTFSGEDDEADCQEAQPGPQSHPGTWGKFDCFAPTGVQGVATSV